MKYNAQQFDPTGHRVLIKMLKIEDKTRAGIVIAQSAQTKEQQGCQFAEVLRVGPTAFKDFGGTAWCKAGDTVVTERYPGSKHESEHYGQKYRIRRRFASAATSE